jgi:hypothetical protein
MIPLSQLINIGYEVICEVTEAYRTKQVHMYRQRNTNIKAPGGARGTGI